MANTTERLNVILESIEDASLREELFQNFHLVNPLEFARLLHSLTISDSVKSQLLALKVGQKTPYKGPELSPLVEKAMTAFWNRLGEMKV